MLDLKKRQTLKYIGAAPLVSLPFVASADSADLSKSITADSAMRSAGTSMQLQIQIIDSSAVRDGNVIVRNISDESIIISRFMPGHIAFDGKLIDLNETVGGQNLDLKAGQSKAFLFDLLSEGTTQTFEYVWADHAIEALSHETSVVTLSAFMADSNAVVYADTTQYIAA